MRVLVFISYFLPGFKSGGPVKTLKNMVDNLDIDFYIVTLNHDIDGTMYDVKNNIWKKSFGTNIFYTEKKDVNKEFFTKIIGQINPDYIYINSFFDRIFSMRFVFSNINGKIFDKNKVILAPRGEFSSGALKIKKIRKKIYLNISNYLGLYSDIRIQASNSLEMNDIKKKLLCKEICIASDIPDIIEFKDSVKSFNELKIIHLSRITKIKNLIFCLSVLKKCKINVQFDIYGPIEDKEYWEICRNEILQMPKNIKVNYLGEIEPKNIQSIFSKYNLLFLPSLGENFCHVIAESFSCGVPVLISDRTPWKNLESASLGWDFSLARFDKFVNTINNFNESSIGKLSSFELYKNYLSYFDLNNIIDSNYKIFSNVDD